MVSTLWRNICKAQGRSDERVTAKRYKCWLIWSLSPQNTFLLPSKMALGV